MIERLIERAGGQPYSLQEGANGATPKDQLMRRIIDGFAEYEPAIIRARTRAALAVKKVRGEVIGAVPYGYKHHGGRLIPHPAEQRLIARVWELHAAGLSPYKIDHELYVEGFRNRRGNAGAPKQVARLIAA
jgi:DNA invertase Pin-like site-specific DNA recombinase